MVCTVQVANPSTNADPKSLAGDWVEPLPEEFDPVEICAPLTGTDADENGSVSSRSDNGQGSGNGEKKEIVLGRNIHTSCLTITEPDVDDEITGEREGYMASVLAKYRRSLVERTKHHLVILTIWILIMVH